MRVFISNKYKCILYGVDGNEIDIQWFTEFDRF